MSSNLNYIQYTEPMAGAGGGYSDTLNRALRTMLSLSGYNPDASTFPGLAGPIFNVLAFGAVGDTVVDDSIGINAAIAAALAAGGGTILFPPPPVQFTTLQTINVTTAKAAKGITFKSIGRLSVNTPLILIKHTGHGFDCTGAVDLVFDNITVQGHASTTPQTAWFLARELYVPIPANSATSGRHTFINCRSAGAFSDSVVYSYGSEENEYHSCRFFNTKVNGKVFTSTGNNIRGLASTVAGITVATGGQSNVITNIFGGSFWASSGATADVLYFDGAGSFRVNSAWMLAGDGTTGGRSLCYVDGTNSTSDAVSFHNCHGENVSTTLLKQQRFGVLFGNEAARSHAGWSFENNRISCGALTRTFNINTTNASAAITSAGQFTTDDVGAIIDWPLFGAAGIVTGARILSVTDANNATMTIAATATVAATSVSLRWRTMYAPSNVTPTNFSIRNTLENAPRGFEFAGNLTGTIFEQPDALLAIRNSSIRNRLSGNSANWTIFDSLRSGDVWIDDGALRPAGNLVSRATQGVDFTASTSPTVSLAGTVRVLDDYKTAQFTPTLTLGATPLGSYTTQVGTYTKIGNRVFFDIYIVVNTVGAGVGTVTVGGLPFTAASANPAAQNYPVTVKLDGSNLTAGFLSAYIPNGGTNLFVQISTYGSPTTNANLADTNLRVGTAMMISGSYRV